MSKTTKCDICGKTFDRGFLIDVRSQGGYSFTDIASDRFELRERDVCRECYYKIKEMAQSITRGAE